MPIYKMEVVTQVLMIQAASEEEAEAKYDAFFTWGEDCPCGVKDCECVEDVDDVYHSTTEEKEGN